MLKQWKTWLYTGLYLSPITVLLLHAYNGAYTRFLSDDYCSIYFAKRLGFLRDIWFWYKNVQGRYSLFATDTLLLWVGTERIGIVPTLAMIIWGSATIATLYGIQPSSREKKLKLRDSIGFGLVLLFVILMLAPNLPQSLYWWNGLATHTFPLIVFTIFLAIYQWIRTLQANKKTIIIAASAAFFLAIVDGGFSETFTATQIILFVFWLGWLYLRKELDFRQPGPVYLAASLVGALVALVLALISPGNVARQAYFPETPGVLTIVQVSFASFFAFLKDILVSPEKALGVIGTFLGFLWFGEQVRAERSIKNWEPLAVFITGIILTFTCFPPAAYGMSEAPPPRAQIIPDLFLLLGTASAAYLWGNLRNQTQSTTQNVRENLWILATTTLLIMIAAGINGKALYNSSAKYIKYAQAWDENEQKIFDAINAGQETVIIHSVRNWAGLNDPGDNPKFFVNYCMTRLYGINILADNTGMQPPEP